MEKLLELLNEYESTLEPNEQIERTENWVKATPLIIISNKFKFIKWLVDNGKIDKRQVHCLCRTDDMEYNYSERELILMELAIQDEPIEFLIGLLKNA